MRSARVLPFYVVPWQIHRYKVQIQQSVVCLTRRASSSSCKYSLSCPPLLLLEAWQFTPPLGAPPFAAALPLPLLHNNGTQAVSSAFVQPYVKYSMLT